MEEERENSTAALAPSAGTIVLPGTAVAANWPPTRNNNNNNSTLPTLSSSSAAATAASSSSHFRGGFSSSICGGLFRHHDVTHSDCCALACCGIFLEDRNRFLLAASGVPPPPLWKRVVQYVGMPVVLALVVGVILTKTLGLDQLEENSNNNSSSSNGNKNNSNSESSDQTQQEQIDKALIRFLVLTVLILLLQVYYCLAVPRRRAERQKIIDRIQAMQNQQQQQQQQHGTTPGSSQTFPYQQGSSPPSMYEMKRELQSSHPMCCCCGFYPQDRLPYQQQEQYQQQQPPVSNDLCYCLWQALSKLCCGFCCMCWCQCCGSCALAQEDRELQRILPPEEFQRDYITMESHAEYYPRILRVRELRQGSVWAHYQALSQLSKQLLVWLVGIWIFLALTSFLPFHALGPGQVLLGLAVLGQALILLLLVHWIWHRFDLSLDAVIKYFASGFCLCTGMTLLYEIGVSMSTGIILSIIKLVFMLDGFLKVMQDSSNSDTNSNNDDANQSSNAARKWAEYVKEFDRHHMGLVVLGAFVNAFFVAAAVEEMTKYFSFWMVDHPDLQTGNDNLAAPTTTTTTTVALDSSHANGTATDETAIVISSPQILVSSSANTNGFAGTTNTTLPPSLARNRRSNASRGAAITVAMVTTALGFACAENFLYVFVYSPANVAIQVFTLILRAMFPVHPVCAALQSIGVCQRDILSKYTTLASSSSSSSSTYSYANTGSGVDATKRLGLGRILLPAWLLHGTFDFSLMVLAAWVAANHPTSSNNDDATNSNNNNGGNDDNANSNNNNDTVTVDESAGVADLISLILSVVIFASGLVYYFWASWRQRRALKALDDMLDQTDTIENSSNNNNQEPSSSDAMVLASQPVQATLVTNLAYVPTSHTNNNNTRSDPSTSADWIV